MHSPVNASGKQLASEKKWGYSRWGGNSDADGAGERDVQYATYKRCVIVMSHRQFATAVRASA